MTGNCAVLWREGNGHIYTGTVEFGARDLTLEGSCHGRHPTLRTIRFGDLAGMHLTRASDESIYRKLTLVLELPAGEPVGIASAQGDGTLLDLEQEIASLVPGIPAD
jgi:hypothetical protein